MVLPFVSIARLAAPAVHTNSRRLIMLYFVVDNDGLELLLGAFVGCVVD
jgi:hypothetical protein